MKKKMLFIFSGFTLLFFLNLRAETEFDRFDIDEIYINAIYVENVGSNDAFLLNESYFNLEWQKNKDFKLSFRAGTSDQRKSLYIFAKHKQEFSLVEAYTEVSLLYGKLFVGFIPIGFGYEALEKNTNLSFRRSFLYSKQLMMQKDLGIKYVIKNDLFYTSLAIHNGESGEQKDGHLWFTSHWWWRDADKFKIGLSAQVGRTSKEATLNLDDSLNVLIIDKLYAINRWRLAGPYIVWQPNFLLKIVTEAYWGGVEQSNLDKEKQWLQFHSDLFINFSKTYQLGFRYDLLDPDRFSSGDMIQEISVLFGIMNFYQYSKLLLSYSYFQNQQSLLVEPEHQLMIQWKVN